MPQPWMKSNHQRHIMKVCRSFKWKDAAGLADITSVMPTTEVRVRLPLGIPVFEAFPYCF